MKCLVEKKFFMTILLLVTVFLKNALADDSGICGNGCEWTLSDGKLHISVAKDYSTAAMADYNAYEAPWYENRRSITSIEIDEGITSIGKYTFFQTNATSLVIPASVKTIGLGGISQMPISDIVFSPNSQLKTIVDGAFSGNSQLKNLKIPEGVTRIGRNIVEGCNVKSIVLPDSVFEEKSTLNAAALTGVQTIYCSQKNAKKCEDWLETARYSVGHHDTYPLKDVATLEFYEKYGDEYLCNGKFYSSLGDIGTTNSIKKRIYTVDEANMVTGKINNFKIRYK